MLNLAGPVSVFELVENEVAPIQLVFELVQDFLVARRRVPLPVLVLILNGGGLERVFLMRR